MLLPAATNRPRGEDLLFSWNGVTNLVEGPPGSSLRPGATLLCFA
jgi:hypothetical protein